MNKHIAGLFLFVCICSFAYAEQLTELQRIHDLNAAAQKGGISNLLALAKGYQWQAPRMLSKWSVEHRPSPEDRRKTDLASRDFGRNLAIQLDAVALILQDLPPGDELKRQAYLLCDLSDWCASAPGHGNLFLAQRCLDLSAVCLARLTASLDFPLVECEKLAVRMSPEWMSVEARARTLNEEAGTNLFAIGGTQSEMNSTWSSGSFMMREKRSGISRTQGRKPHRDFMETPVIKANLDLFEDDDEPRVAPLTVVRSWDSKRHERIVVGLELQNVNQALALLKFRTVIGSFPERVEFSEDQLRRRDEERVSYAKLGIKVGSMYEGMAPGAAAFLYAWDLRKDKNPKDHNLDAPAWQAYSEVRNGQFLDQDTREERMATQTTVGGNFTDIGVKSPQATNEMTR